MTVTDWTAISALILSAGATALVILNTRWLQEWKWKLDLLTERHREIEAVANEVDATLYFEITGDFPSHYDQHTGDWVARVYRKYLQGLSTYKRVKSHLPRATTRALDRALAEIEAIREPGRGEERLVSQGAFLNDLAKALERAAYPGMK